VVKVLLRNHWLKECGNENDVLYIATSIPFDEEMKKRVKKHKERRPSGWTTLEAYRDFDIKLDKAGAGKKYILLDCITIMVSNIILEKCIDWNILPEKPRMKRRWKLYVRLKSFFAL